MMISYFLVLFLINSINCNPTVRDETDVCNFNGYFVPSNGYGWTKRDNQIICTCPDTRYEINRPCRICQRPTICGPQDALCSEEEPSFISANNTSHFTCFCSSGVFSIGKKCPEELTTIGPSTTQIEVTNTTTFTTMTASITTTPMSTTFSMMETSTATLSSITSTTTTAPMTTTSILTTVSIIETSTVTLSPTTSTTQITRTTTTTTRIKDITTTTSPCDARSSSSYLIVKPFLIILLNLVYFVNK